MEEQSEVLPSVSLELEHFIGVSNIPNGVIFHPNGNNYVVCAGGNVIIGDLVNPNEQTFLKR